MANERLNDLIRHIQSPVPFWFLNGHVEEWHIVREFEMMKKKGISDVIVHPRYGLEVAYLSDEWFEIFGWCVREAKKHGMHIWIYDEFNWPSGTAGMTVMNENPDFRSKYLAVEAKPLGEVDYARFEAGHFMVAANIEAGIVTKTRFLPDAHAAKALTGDWMLLNCTVKYDPYYIDTLSKAAVDCFKEKTYEAYYARFGNEFGNTIRAVFTDEPSIYWVSVGYDDWNLPYTDDYFETFEQRFGYRPEPMIPYLFYPGKEASQFRADYWDHAGHLFNERYHRNLSEWCREHGVFYTGHNNHEEPLRYQIRFQGDMFGTMRTMDIPGVDHLGKQTLGNSWISIVGHKICSSQAHVSGKARCMSESFGLMEWDATYENLKRVTDWQYALGINLLIPHAIYHTISGMTKRESPPSFFYQSPQWEDFDYFADYLKRMEEMLCGGRHLCKVAVFYPLSGLWSTYQSDRKTSDFEQIENFLSSLCLEMVKNQIDFDIVDFAALQTSEIVGKHIRLANEDYEYLIVPATPYLRPAEIAKLNEIVTAKVNTTFFYRSMEPISENVPEGLRGGNFVRTEELEAFIEILKRELDDDIQIVGGGADDIMAYRREKDEHKITFLLNRSDKHRKVTATLKNYQDAAIFDQETGSYTRLVGHQTGKKLQAQLRFQPNQSYFIVSGISDARQAREPEGEPTIVEITNLTVTAPFNIASIYKFTYKGADQEPLEIDVRANPRYIPCNWDPNPPTFDQFAGVYEAELEVELPQANNVIMILDRDFADCEVYINEIPIVLAPCAPGMPPDLGGARFYLTDFQDMWAPVGHLLLEHPNKIKIVSNTKLSEPVRFVGDFRVELKGSKVVLSELNETNVFAMEMDYPFYSGTLSYRGEFEAKTYFSSLILNLHDVHDAATVIVNGQLAGKRLWPPYIIDIADYSTLGTNQLEIEVRNNMTNLILGNPRRLGLTRMPTLAGWTQFLSSE